MTEYDGISLLDDSEEYEDSLVELGSGVFMLLDDEDDSSGEVEFSNRISIGEMVKGMGITEPVSLDLGYEFDESLDDEIEGIDLTGLVEDIDPSSLNVLPATLITNLREEERSIPFSGIFLNQIYGDGEATVLHEPVSLQEASKNFVGHNGDMASILYAEDTYKSLLVGALNGVVNGLFHPTVNSGILTYLRNNSGIKSSRDNRNNSSLDEAIRSAIDEFFVEPSTQKSGKGVTRRMFRGEQGGVFEPDDNSIATKVVELLMDSGYLSTIIASNGESYSQIKDRVLNQIDATFYDKDMASKAGSVRLRDWFKDTVTISTYLLYTLVIYPLLNGSASVPLVKTERTSLTGDPNPNRSVGHSFKIVFSDSKGATSTVDAAKVFDLESPSEYLRRAPGEVPLFTKEITGITDYSYLDSNNELDFILHQVFSLGDYKGIKGSGSTAKLIMKCDCGDNYSEVTPNIQAVVYYLSNMNSYKVQLVYVPVLCPFCRRVMLVKRDLLDSISRRIEEALRNNSGDNVRFIASSQRNYGFKLTPPHVLAFLNQSEDILQLEDEESFVPEISITSEYEGADLTRHILAYERLLAKFRKIKKGGGVILDSNLSYVLCGLLSKDYKELKLQAISSVLANLSDKGVLSTTSEDLKDSLLHFWDKKEISFAEYEDNLLLLTKAANQNLSEEDGVAMTVDLLRESPDGEALKESPVDLLMHRPLEERWDFLRLICLRFFPEEKVDVSGGEVEWFVRYEEIGSRLQSLPTLVSLDSLVEVLNINMESIACGGMRTVLLDYRQFSSLFKSEAFLEFLDKCSDLMLMVSLTDDIVRYMLKTPKELSTFVANDCRLDILEVQLKKKVIEKAASALSEDGQMSTRLDSQYFYKLFYNTDKEFKRAVDEAIVSRKKTVVRSYSKGKWLTDLYNYTGEVCSHEDSEGLYDKLRDWSRSLQEAKADKFTETLLDLKEVLSGGNYAVTKTKVYRNLGTVIEELSNVATIKGKDECLKQASRFYRIEITNYLNLVQRVLEFKELASSAVLSMILEYYRGNSFVKAYFLYASGISPSTPRGRSGDIHDYIVGDLNEDYAFQMFLLNLIYPVSDMNFVREKDDADEGFSVSDNFLLTHSNRLINEYYTILLNVIPDEYKEKLAGYLGEE